jgi:hypothetical protein
MYTINRLIMITMLMLVLVMLVVQIDWIEHYIDTTFESTYSVSAIDVDNDGDVDILGAALDEGDITWWESDLATADVGPISIDIP